MFECFEHDEMNVMDVLYTVRTLMERRYGVGTDLTGHCIEASDIIVDMLKVFGCKSVRAVEGWCHYDDEHYCSDRSYDPHTWVELNGYYLDVTADQFNFGMFKENEFPSVIFQKGLPHGMCYAEPVELYVKDC